MFGFLVFETESESKVMKIVLKRIYEKPSLEDGYRILVDRIWPRGISKEDAKIDEWLKDIAPSNELRKWFNHDPEKWDEFKERYFAELESNKEQLENIYSIVRQHHTTFLYSAKNEDFNNAVALKGYIEKQMK